MEPLYRYERSEVFGRRGDPMTVQRNDTQGFCAPHEHDFIEIVLVVSGTGSQKTAIKPGSVTILRPGHWHSYVECRNLVIYNCCFGPELLRRELSWLTDDPKLTWLLLGAGENSGTPEPTVSTLRPAVRKRLQDVLDNFRKSDTSSFGIKVSWLALFVTTLAQNLSVSGPTAVEQRIHPSVIKTIRLIEADLGRPWTLRNLAQHSGLSTEYLIRLFKGTMGMTPYAYLNRCRAERAAALLLRTNLGIAEIGQKVGWSEPCHFSRRFKRQFGMSASSYRNDMKKKLPA
jgi:AraC family L-rhamnose operon transcriptional activator RhaR